MIKVENYFEVFIIISLVSLFFYLIKGFIISLFLAVSFVFIFYKPYQKLKQKTKNKTISAIFIIFLAITLILLPTYLLLTSLIEQTSSIIQNSDSIVNNLNFDNCQYFFCNTLKSNVNVIDLKFDSIVTKTGQYLINSFSEIFNSITTIILNFFVFILAFYYLLVDGENFLQSIKKMIPMKNDYKDALFYRFKDVTLAVFVDSIFVAMIQGGLVGLGFWFFELNSPIFWATIASFFALIPMIGTAFVWVPGVLYLYSQQDYLSAILLLLYGGVVISLSDNFIRPFLIKQKIKVHSFLILLSILGGLEVFGFIGIFLGPIIISLLITIFQLYKLDFR